MVLCLHSKRSREPADTEMNEVRFGDVAGGILLYEDILKILWQCNAMREDTYKD